jgi:hypothetical protein
LSDVTIAIDFAGAPSLGAVVADGVLGAAGGGGGGALATATGAGDVVGAGEAGTGGGVGGAGATATMAGVLGGFAKRADASILRASGRRF